MDSSMEWLFLTAQWTFFHEKEKQAWAKTDSYLDKDVSSSCVKQFSGNVLKRKKQKNSWEVLVTLFVAIKPVTVFQFKTNSTNGWTCFAIPMINKIFLFFQESFYCMSWMVTLAPKNRRKKLWMLSKNSRTFEFQKKTNNLEVDMFEMRNLTKYFFY